LAAVGAKAIEPTDGHASHAAGLSIVFGAVAFDRDRFTARTVRAATMISPVPRMIPARRLLLVYCLFAIPLTTLPAIIWSILDILNVL
jgi:hypothetical protein